MNESLDWQDLSDALASRCASFGLDVTRPLRIGWYNDAVDAPHRIADGGDRERLAVLIGNTRALWPRFVEWLGADAARLGMPNPVDSYVTDRVGRALRYGPPPSALRWAHLPEPRHVAFQRLASVAGLAWLSPSYLSVHPTFGPWLAFRAVAVFDCPGPSRRPPAPASPCAGRCETQCMPALRRAVADTRAAAGHPAAARVWERWLEVRDACPAGREYRIDDAQIRYHYLKDRDTLRGLVALPE